MLWDRSQRRAQCCFEACEFQRSPTACSDHQKVLPQLEGIADVAEARSDFPKHLGSRKQQDDAIPTKCVRFPLIPSTSSRSASDNVPSTYSGEALRPANRPASP